MNEILSPAIISQVDEQFWQWEFKQRKRESHDIWFSWLSRIHQELISRIGDLVTSQRDSSEEIARILEIIWVHRLWASTDIGYKNIAGYRIIVSVMNYLIKSWKMISNDWKLVVKLSDNGEMFGKITKINIQGGTVVIDYSFFTTTIEYDSIKISIEKLLQSTTGH